VKLGETDPSTEVDDAGVRVVERKDDSVARVNLLYGDAVQVL